MNTPIPWRPNATAFYRRLRVIAHEDDYHLGAVLVKIVQRADPDESLLARALRQVEVWPHRLSVNDDRGGNWQVARTSIFELVPAVEHLARTDSARSVGERHLAQHLATSASSFGVNPTELVARVTEMELGPAFPAAELAESYHVMIDAPIIAQGKNLEHILWEKELGHLAVTLWVPGTLLNELDALTYTSPSRRVRDRARAFAKMLRPQLDIALRFPGIEMRPGVRLRVWAPVGDLGLRDTDHLEAALSLRERGVPLAVLTQDTGLAARAILQAFVTHELSTDSLQPPEPTEAEERERRRREIEGIEAPPIVHMEVERRQPTEDGLPVYLVCSPSGGEAREVSVAWNADFAGQAGGVQNRLDGQQGPLFREGDGRFHQQLSRLLSPGTREMIAEIVGRPEDVSYEVRAAKSLPHQGKLVWMANDASLEEAEPGT